MLNIIADTHTHTLASDHAYSTITENAVAASAKGLQFLAMTEHTPSIPGAPSLLHFTNNKCLPRYLEGVLLLKGAEVNIMDYKGRFDLPDHILDMQEWVIASLHSPCIPSGTTGQITDCWIAVTNNPLVDVIGHCGDSRYAFDHRPAIREFARTGKIVEINNHSFRARPGSSENCRKIAELCAEYGVQIVISSDAHFHTDVGEFSGAVAMLEEIGYPEELILNADYDRFLAVAREKSGKLLTDGK